MSGPIPIYHLDAFTRRVFGGNPAAVCPLERWLDDPVLQAIAAENQIAETAFFVGGGGRYQIRWFTPVAEVDLCGHATLTSAHVIFERLDPALREVRFESKSGELKVRRREDRLELDFPSRPPEPAALPEAAGRAFGRAPLQAWRSRDLMLVYETEAEVRALVPEFATIASLADFGVIVTAPGERVDFVSRFFAPRKGVPEDHATGSAHCTLAPYWAKRLGRTSLHALQVSPRGAELWCELAGDRVLISGHVAPYLEGSIRVPTTSEGEIVGKVLTGRI